MVVAAYSLGQSLASPLFGVLGNRVSTLTLLAVSQFPVVLGNIMYAMTGALPPGAIASWWMTAGRLLVGFGGGVMVVARSYCSTCTRRDERNTFLTIVSAAQAIGFIVGPAR